MGGWAFFFFAAAIVTGASLLISDLVRRQHELDYMIKLRNSDMYRDFYPMIQYVRRHHLDRVQIEKTRIFFYGLNPPGVLDCFVLADWNYKPLTDRQMRALTLVLAEDIDPLQEKEWYRLKQFKIERPNGRKDVAYRYIITYKYKAQLLSARNRVRLY